MGKKNRKKNKGGGGQRNPQSPANQHKNNASSGCNENENNTHSPALVQSPLVQEETMQIVNNGATSAIAELLGLNLSMSMSTDPVFDETAKKVDGDDDKAADEADAKNQEETSKEGASDADEYLASKQEDDVFYEAQMETAVPDLRADQDNGKPTESVDETPSHAQKSTDKNIAGVESSQDLPEEEIKEIMAPEVESAPENQEKSEPVEDLGQAAPLPEVEANGEKITVTVSPDMDLSDDTDKAEQSVGSTTPVLKPSGESEAVEQIGQDAEQPPDEAQAPEDNAAESKEAMEVKLRAKEQEALRAEEQARQDKKKKAEEAKRKAEKRKADDLARLQAVKEASLKAEAEEAARIKAEDEARKAEAEAFLKIEEEARRKAKEEELMIQEQKSKEEGERRMEKLASSRRLHNAPSPSDMKLASQQRISRAGAVDVVTGIAKTDFFFDPREIVETKSEFSSSSFKSPSRRGTGNYDDSQESSLYNSKHLYMPCSIVKSLRGEVEVEDLDESFDTYGPALVKTTDGTLYKIREVDNLIPLTAPDDYEGVKDVLNLANISEASLLHTLRIRYKRDHIYTSAGPILISINPYKQITMNGASLYSPQKMMEYRQSESFGQEVEPHLFQVADRAYSAMMDSIHSVPLLEEEDASIVLEGDIGIQPGQPRNQSIIISGESGAGKTESTKYIMQYLARITKRKSNKYQGIQTPPPSPNGSVAALEDKVLSSNPLLETFGNAQTLRNDNSSRFGKFIHINFSTDTGAIVGARISNYLLEKTRITQQIDGERNYHIFYQLFAGAEPELLGRLGLENGPATFNYLGNRSSPKTKNDLRNYQETVACLTQIGLSVDDQETVFRLAAAVLHLGNVSFQESTSGDHTAVMMDESKTYLEKACLLLGLGVKDVSDAILTKLLTIGGKTIKKPSSVAMAEDKRDAFAKMTYSCVFLWLVDAINKTLDHSGKLSSIRDDGFIGVLDIYGFETFETNGYEQLLINYCNEKLQRHFNRHLFEVEQNLYSTEGVDWTYITFNDNRPCLELIEGGPGKGGILSTLDDAYSGMGENREKDIKFVGHLHKLFGSVAGAKQGGGGHEYFITPKFGSDRTFIIAHYAGEVKYTADGFVEKNMESLSTELKELGGTSSVELVRNVYSQASGSIDSLPQGASRRSSIRGFSIASQFKISLQSLVEDLEKTQPHYIRCVKPNLKKAPNAFNAGEVLKQLRYSGMMEAIRIRREGYALREPHQSFFARFSVLMGPDDLKYGGGIEQLVKVLSKRLNVSDADWQIGHSKIFLRRELSDKLERLAKLRVHVAARCLGKFGRGVVLRRLSSFMVAWTRFRLKMRAKHRIHRGLSRLQAIFRARYLEKKYVLWRSMALKIQSQQRRRLAFARVRRLRDPYYDHTYNDVKKLLKEEKRAMEAAVKAQDFPLAAKKEAKVEKLSLVLEAKRPLTRRRLEESIKKIQVSLEQTLQRKAYTEAGPLQDELETLLKRRQELPTMTELKDAVVSAEVALASAASNRDFAEAASAQQRLDRARKTLQATIEAEDESDEEENTGESDGVVQASLSIEGVECRADLETEIISLQEQVSAAIARKDFKSATNLQAKLDSREALRAFFPSRAELEVELANKRKELADAVAIKDFAEAGRLNGVIERLEQQIKNEEDNSLHHGSADEAFVSAMLLDGETKTFSSRFDLEEEIKSLKSSQSEAVARREFKQAETCQQLIESLENLRTRLPTAAELSRSILSKKSEMQKAIVEKRFAEAEALDIEIIKLEKKLTEEKSKNPPESAAPKPVIAALEGGVKAKVSVTPAATSSLITNRRLNEDVHQNRNKKKQEQQHTTVSALRPRKPVVSSLTTTVLEICKVMTDYRSDAALLVDEQGRIAGIITDTDVTRKVVAKHIDPNSCPVLSAMTASPTCVKVSDSADSALATMLENHIRHLPVLDDDGGIVGLLDIAKCLNDAISKLEEADQRKESVGRDDLLDAITTDERQKARLQTLLGPLLKQTEGQTGFSTTLRAMLRDSPANVVEPTTSVLEASALMADRRKAALVVENGKLTGIFGFKDMMSRVVAKQLPLDLTEVNTVMTPHPEFVSPDMTVLEALQTMHDNKFLTLPVCEDDGMVVGMVDVMDVIKGCGGVDGWRSAFGRSFENDVITESPSFSRSIQSSKETGSAKPKDGRLVSKLRPKKPILSSSNDSILAVTRLLASKRGSAALVVSGDGNLAGILTDKDVTTRVVAKHLEAATTLVSHVMTKSPTCVSMNDTAINAMSTMIENQFRHLPVVDENGGIVGLLDIAKCLNDALSKLEKSQMKSKEAASDALLQAVSGQGSKGDQALALQALLGPLMSQAFGSQSSPPLRSILNQTSCSTVTPDTSVLDAAMVMAETRRAALVVEDGHLAGIFGFKDMMTRVVAKELSLETTEISAVMTPSPEMATPDMTVLEALQMMHDNNFLTLPVCEDDGTVLSVVDVMDLIHGSGGSEGWRSIFNSTLDLEDNSDTASFYSGRAGSLAKSTRSKSKRQPDDGHSTPAVDARMVSKLRPRKPIVANSSESVLAVTQILANKRGDAALIVGSKGELKGIFTDTDVTRRVVAKHLDPSSIVVSKVMTKNPTCVAVSDLAMDAMSTMVENHFRHLPVIDDSGGVVGLLDIAKCLNDAISKLEKAESSSNNDSASEVLKQAVHAQGAKGDQAAAIQALLGPLIAQAFGSQASPSLRSILEGSPGTIVDPKASILKVASVMAQRRKAALVVEDGRLAGIFGFKDMMTRVVAKQLPLDTTDVVEVMTRNPESVLPETTVLEALQIMHDNKFLTLPVCESDGSVLGLVDVMDLIYGCGGVDGWRSIFNSTLDLDDVSDTASLRSGYGSIRKTESKSTVRSSRTAKFESTVSMLRPKKPIIASADQSILEVAQALASKRASAGIIVDSQGGLAGIITDTDFTRRVTAQFIDPSAHSIGEVMTSNPKYVSEYHSAVDAMITMIKNGFRHLPVADEGGEIVGILDIAKCLNDAIRKLERAAEKSSDAAENLIKQALESAGQGGAALKAILGPLVNQTFGSQASRTLGSILIDSSPTVVGSESSVLEAALLMAESRKAALVQEDGKLTGIFGFKDLMCRVVAKELDPGSTQISEVMTPNPEYVSPDVTVLEALQNMHDNHFLTLPVCKSDGSIVGVVNVMDVINGCGGAEGWRAVFDSALELDDDVSAHPSAAHSQSKSKKSSRSKNAANHDQVITVSRDSPFISPRSGNIPTTLEFNEANRFDEGSFNDTFLTDLHMVTFKVVDKDGHTHRLKADPKIASLQKELAKKIGSKNPDLLRFKFLDDEGDAILITTDDDLLEAVKLSRAANTSSSRGAGPVVKLIATEVAEPLAFDPMVLAGVGVAVAVVGLATMYMMRPRRYL